MSFNLSRRRAFIHLKSSFVYCKSNKKNWKTSQIIKIQGLQLLIKDAENHDVEYIIYQSLLHNYQQKNELNAL